MAFTVANGNDEIKRLVADEWVLALVVGNNDADLNKLLVAGNDGEGEISLLPRDAFRDENIGKVDNGGINFVAVGEISGKERWQFKENASEKIRSLPILGICRCTEGYCLHARTESQQVNTERNATKLIIIHYQKTLERKKSK